MGEVFHCSPEFGDMEFFEFLEKMKIVRERQQKKSNNVDFMSVFKNQMQK